MIQRIMSIATDPLPQNYAALQAFAANLQLKYAELETGNEVLRSELYHKTLHIEQLKAELAKLRRQKYGKSSEKLDHQIERAEMILGDLEEGVAESQAKIEHNARSKPSVKKEHPPLPRGTFPAHLPREIIKHEAACICPECGSERMTLLGSDERQVLEYVAAHFKVIIHQLPKSSCRDCENITQVPVPSMPIIRGMAGPALLAHVMVARFDDHLPYYRQSEIYERDGVVLSRSMLAEWVGHMAALMAPLVALIAAHVRMGETIHADETHIAVLEPGRGSTRRGYLWVALRDERPWGSASPPAVYYRYAPSRSAEHAKALLENVRGYLHADGYSGYKDLYLVDPLTNKARLVGVACWAHARRYIFDVNVKRATPATDELLKLIAELFAIEASIKGQPPEERLKARIEHAVPRLAELKLLYEALLGKISGKSELATGLRYALSRWTSLTRYTTDGRLEISNNAIERQIKPMTVGRKNWMFAGTHEGGGRAGNAYTLVETAKLNGLNPEKYLTHVIGRIADHPINRLHELLPWNVKL